MSELDFYKIFGETATSKASFTDENYINGWGYLGSTPPPYQLFDYLQGLNDKKSKYLYDSMNENKNNLLEHNTDEQAHDNRFNAIIQQVNNMITPTDDSDKQSLAPTLALVKTMLGNVGIVSQKLETNGYVKFANGFTIQWGAKYYGDFNGNLPVNINFPVGFQSNPLAIILSEESANSETNAVFHVSGKTATGFTIIGNEWSTATQQSTANWVAVGV